MFVPLRKAVEILGLHPNTLRKYADEGKIKSLKNEAGQRLYDVQSYISGAIRVSLVCYCRVSSTKQRDDLERQVSFMRSFYPEAEIIKDIGSGLNFKRKGLRAILDRLLQGDKLTLVVAHRDRLCRFGFELIQYMVERNGGQIMVQGPTVHSPESELTADLLSILHIFSCRMHDGLQCGDAGSPPSPRLRKYSKKIKEDKTLPHNGTEEDD